MEVDEMVVGGVLGGRGGRAWSGGRGIVRESPEDCAFCVVEGWSCFVSVLCVFCFCFCDADYVLGCWTDRKPLSYLTVVYLSVD